MNANILAISNILAGMGNGPASAMPKAVKEGNQSSSLPLDSRPFEYARGTKTVDNPQFQNKNSLDNETPLDFRHNHRGEKLPQYAVWLTPLQLKARDNIGTKRQNQSTDTAIQPTTIQFKLAECLQNGPPKAGCKNNQLPMNLNPDECPLLAIKPVWVVSQVQNPPTENSHKISKRPFIIEPPSNKGEIANRIQNPTTTLHAARGPDNEQNGDELNMQALVQAQYRTVGLWLADSKPEFVPAPNSGDNQETPQLIREQFAPETPVNINNGTNKPCPKLRLWRITDKPSVLQSEPFGIGLSAKADLPAEYTDVDEAATGQPHRIQAQRFWGPPVDDVIVRGRDSAEPLIYQHLHRTQHQISTGPIKGRDDSAPGDNNSGTGFERLFFGENTATCITEQTPAFSEAGKSENLPPEIPLRDIAENITAKFLESVHSSSSQEAGTQQITLRLNPPELGKVLIKFEEQENVICGLLEVSKAQTRYEVERALPSIIQNLADSGIEIKRLEVVLTNQGEQHSFRDELLQDGLFQHHQYLPEYNNPENYGTIGADEPGLFGSESGYHNNPESTSILRTLP